MNKLVNKHDLLTKRFLSDIVIAKEFITTHLAPEILAKVNIDSIRIEPCSYIEEDLVASYSDIVYRFELRENKGDIYLYSLLEHQSRAEELMPLRILRYQINIIQKHLDTFKDSVHLPVVIAWVFYNGKKSPYPYELDISELFLEKEIYKKARLKVKVQNLSTRVILE